MGVPYNLTIVTCGILCKKAVAAVFKTLAGSGLQLGFCLFGFRFC